MRSKTWEGGGRGVASKQIPDVQMIKSETGGSGVGCDVEQKNNLD
jgi:hypothetical protein